MRSFSLRLNSSPKIRTHVAVLSWLSSILKITLKNTGVYISWSRLIFHFSNFFFLRGILASCACHNLKKIYWSCAYMSLWTTRFGVRFGAEPLSSWPNHVKTAPYICVKTCSFVFVGFKRIWKELKYFLRKMTPYCKVQIKDISLANRSLQIYSTCFPYCVQEGSSDLSGPKEQLVFPFWR